METPMERLLRLLKEETGSTEFQESWRTSRSRAEKLLSVVVIREGKSWPITINDDDTEEAARAKVQTITPKLTPILPSAEEEPA